MATHTAKPTDGPSADQALARLIAGNERFVRGESRLAGDSVKSLSELARGQRPYATILGCSDSRVPPEWVFDAGLGELFVVRVAGNVFSPEVAGSMQYAGAHLHTPLIVVLGHEGCGAVGAALDTIQAAARHHSRIQILVDSIVPGLPAFDPQHSREQRLALAVESNVRWTTNQIRATPEARARTAEGRLKVVGAVYEIESGRVRFLPERI
jgi:carbonic anhydrase